MRYRVMVTNEPAVTRDTVEAAIGHVRAKLYVTDSDAFIVKELDRIGTWSGGYAFKSAGIEAVT